MAKIKLKNSDGSHKAGSVLNVGTDIDEGRARWLVVAGRATTVSEPEKKAATPAKAEPK